MRYENHILKMQDFEGFHRKFCALIGYYATHEEAYEAAERIYESHFGRHRYKNYETFKATTTRHFKRNKTT